jgi:hypothetical protein
MSEQEDPKIIVDEDWKSQVKAEKELADEQPAEQAEQPEMPPPSLELLVTSLAAQAAVGLGLMPDPFSNSTHLELDMAKHHIDMLGVIEEKTKGNLSKEEHEMLDSALHELRMLYVQVSNNPPSESEDSPPSGGIVTP